jgi:uncharacterized metal-binding protein YceD (DUF177 family)
MTIETDWMIAIRDVPHNGLHVVRSATDEECSALAKALGILECTALDCDIRIRALRQGRYQVAGRITAQVIQACVVSLEPVASRVEESLDVEFWPRDQITPPVSTAGEEWFDPQSPDGAEAIEDGQIALGRLIYECIAAGLDPYPRKPGATLAWTEKPELAAEIHPFAALAKLKKKE